MVGSVQETRVLVIGVVEREDEGMKADRDNDDNEDGGGAEEQNNKMIIGMSSSLSFSTSSPATSSLQSSHPQKDGTDKS